MTEAEKDRIALMVLRLVQSIVKPIVEFKAPPPEPTGAGHIDSDVREFVMKRSA